LDAHHDNAPGHTAISVNEFVTKKGIPVVPQPLYSPDLSPCNFFLFPKLKFHLKDRHFGTVDNIQKVVTEQLRALPHEDFPALLPGVGATSPTVCGFPRELLLKGIMLICSSVVNKKFYSTSLITL